MGVDALTICSETCQSVVDGFHGCDFSGWDVLGKAEDGMFYIGLHEGLCLIYDPRRPSPFILDILGMELPVRDIEWRWDLTIALDGWNVTVRRTT